jgi:hypothetical protein
LKPAVRRGLLFLAMSGAGVAAVLLLSDPLTSRHPAHVESLTGAEDEGGRLRLRPGDGQGETQVVFGELDFDIVRSVEVSPGVHEDRVAARAHILSARPDEGGVFVAQGPSVRMLDTTTGAERGTLSAREARFLTGGATGDDITLDLATLRAEDWTLRGEVRGSFPLSDGRIARLECEELSVHGSVVRGPGQVTWTREDLALSGLDFTWDDATGRMTYDAAAHVSIAPAEGRLGLELDATGGLSWTVPPDAADPRTAAYGELRGPVSGTASDGSRLAAQLVLMDGRTNTLVLQGGARLLRREPDGSESRLSAGRITAVSGADGRFARADAEGGVRLDAQPAAGAPSWLTTETLSVEGERVRAPGRVAWNREAFGVAGDNLDWDRATGRLSIEKDAVLSVAEGSGHDWAGLRLLAPGGLTWQSPPGEPDALSAGRGELHGPVTGTLPDGTTLAADAVFCDGPERQVRLVGGASFKRVLRGEETHLDAHEVMLAADAEGRLALGAATGNVIVISGPPGEPQGRLVSESLQREGGLLTAPGSVSWSRGDVSVAGEGLSWDEPAGRLDIHRDARLTLVQPQTRLRYELLAAGGLAWTVPPGAKDAATEGRGELRGRVTGHGSDGSTLACDRMLVDGPSRAIELHGAARLDVAGAAGRPPATLEGESLRLASHPDGNTLGADAPAVFSLGALHGSGTGLSWDGRTGHLRIERDVRMAQPAVEGSPDLQLSAAGPLDWTVPPGAADPVRAGQGEVQGDVRIESGTRTLTTTHLLASGPAGTTELRGPSRIDSTQADGLRIASEQGIVLQGTLDGEPTGLRATGGAETWLYPRDGGAPLHVMADEIVGDRAAGRVELRGHARLERVDGTQRLAASADQVIVRLDEQDQPVWLEATGGVELTANDMQATGSSLTWDVPADLARLIGPGRLVSAGLEMTFSAAEVHPEAERFRIEHSVVHVQR